MTASSRSDALAGAPLNAAHQQIRLAELLADAGEAEAASLELAAAMAIFRKAAADALVARCESLARSLAADR